jgi:hypothetical protein
MPTPAIFSIRFCSFFCPSRPSQNVSADIPMIT